MSPRHHSSSYPSRPACSSTASSACRLLWTSDMTATRKSWWLGGVGVVFAVVLGQQLDALPRRPLRVVVLQRVDQLAHEERRQVDPHDRDTGHLGALDVVVDARERDRELVVRVADVGEVRVHPGQCLRLDLDVEMPFLWLGLHAYSLGSLVWRSLVLHPRRTGAPSLGAW